MTIHTIQVSNFKFEENLFSPMLAGCTTSTIIAGNVEINEDIDILKGLIESLKDFNMARVPSGYNSEFNIGLEHYSASIQYQEQGFELDFEPEIIREGFVKIPPMMKFKAKGTVKAAKFGTLKVREPNSEHSGFVKIPPQMTIRPKSKKENDSEIE